MEIPEAIAFAKQSNRTKRTVTPYLYVIPGKKGVYACLERSVAMKMQDDRNGIVVAVVDGKFGRFSRLDEVSQLLSFAFPPDETGEDEAGETET